MKRADGATMTSGEMEDVIRSASAEIDRLRERIRVLEAIIESQAEHVDAPSVLAA